MTVITADARRPFPATRTAIMKKGTPDPIDRHVGSRIRARRVLIRMSQEKLGAAAGVTFQQIQKYERGVNRVSASRLWQFAQILDVEPAYFFQGAPATGSISPSTGYDADDLVYAVLLTAEGRRLGEAFASIADPCFRRRIAGMVASIAATAAGAGTNAGGDVAAPEEALAA